MMSICVLGSGSWGTALAIALSNNHHQVKLWGRNKEQVNEIQKKRENTKYLPNISLPKELVVTNNISEAVEHAEVIVVSTASQSVRSVLNQIKDFILKDSVIVNTAKGIEKDTLLPISQVVKEVLPNHRYVVLSGPSHAEEVSNGMPTTLVAACEYKETAEIIQDLFMSPALRVYTNPDVIGVELGGALKNIIALGAGISDGLGYGDNAKAALMTRGIVEISRLGVKIGAYEGTFSGLTGIGDLIVTCTSMHSRNRRCGILIGEGTKPKDAVAKIGMVVEGMYATDAAYQLSQKYQVEMPITQELYQLFNSGGDVRASVENLMTRQKKHEIEQTAENIIWQV